MALAVPTVYLSVVETRHAKRPDRRLHQDHVADLRALATGVEETDAGVCCRYLIDQLAGTGSADIDDDGYVHQLEDLERFCDRFNVWRHPLIISWRGRIARARRAIVRMRERGEHSEASVLFVAYGHPDPLARQIPELVAMGELGSLVRYTDAVEECRLEMARAEARAIGGAVDLALYRSRLDWAMRSISSGDALRAALAPFSEPMHPPREGETVRDVKAALAARTERRLRHRDRVAEFASRARGEAYRMLLGAERAYHDAWLRSAT